MDASGLNIPPAPPLNIPPAQPAPPAAPLTPQQKLNADYKVLEDSLRKDYWNLSQNNTDIYSDERMLTDAVGSADSNQTVYLIGTILTQLGELNADVQKFKKDYDNYIKLAGLTGHAVPPDIANINPLQPSIVALYLYSLLP